MQNKRISMTEAAALVQDGETLALGGMTLYRRPVAFARALIARPAPPQELTLLAFTAGFAADLLVGAGLVARTRTATLVGDVWAGALYRQPAKNCSHRGKRGQHRPRPAGANGRHRLHAQPRLAGDRFAGGAARRRRLPIYQRAAHHFPRHWCDVAAIHVLRADISSNAASATRPSIWSFA